MSGHSKWSTIKRKKSATDAKRGKIFSKLAREIMVAARQGGGDPDANITLRTVIEKARGVNMPADNIERAIKKGVGDFDGVTLEEMVYEGFAPGGIALLIEALTDNKNRTAAEVRHVFTRYGGNMAGQNSVARLFTRRGQIGIAADTADEERVLEAALESGAEDMSVNSDGSYSVTTDPSSMMEVVDALKEAGIVPDYSEITMLADTAMPVTDRDTAASLLRFVEDLDDLDDVQNVYSNFDIDDALLEELESDD